MDLNRVMTGATDVAFFMVIGFLGWHKVIGEPIIAALLSAYSAYRFGVGMGKAQAVTAMAANGSAREQSSSNAPSSTNRGGSSGGGGGGVDPGTLVVVGGASSMSAWLSKYAHLFNHWGS